MLVKDKVMYHYHRLGHHDSIWKPNSEIIVDQTFHSYLGSVLTEFTTSVTVADDSLRTFDDVLDYYLEEENIEKIDKELLKRILTESRRIIGAMNVYNRELALEEVRKEYFKHLPSRLHSIWVCEEEHLDFWKKTLKGQLELYQVKLDGNLFHSSDLFLPAETLKVSEMRKEAEKYWNPNFQTEEEMLSSEYLFQGKVKVMEKVNKTR